MTDESKLNHPNASALKLFQLCQKIACSYHMENSYSDSSNTRYI